MVVNRFDAGDKSKDRIQVEIRNIPLKFFVPFVSGSFNYRPVQVTRPVESLGAAD